MKLSSRFPKVSLAPYLKKRIENLVKEEELKWALFERYKRSCPWVRKIWTHLKKQERGHGAKQENSTDCSRNQHPYLEGVLVYSTEAIVEFLKGKGSWC